MEEWKDAPGFEGFYQVSNEGHFRSVDRTVIVKTKNGKDKPTHFRSRLLKEYIENGKRSNIKRSVYVAFSVNGKHYRRYIHRLVAEAFLEKTKGAVEVNHIDGNRLNNSVANLEWVTKKENIDHAFEHKLIKTEKPVEQLDKETGKVLNTYRSESEACRQMGITQGKILRSMQRNGPSAGFRWRYKD